MNRPFDLKAALSGEPIQYRDYTPGEFLRTERQPDNRTTVWFARLGSGSEWLETTLDGRVIGVTDGGCDLISMAPRKVKKTVYFNIERTINGLMYGYLYDTEEEARRSHIDAGEVRLREAVPVEIEVEE